MCGRQYSAYELCMSSPTFVASTVHGKRQPAFRSGTGRGGWVGPSADPILKSDMCLNGLKITLEGSGKKYDFQGSADPEL